MLVQYHGILTTEHSTSNLDRSAISTTTSLQLTLRASPGRHVDALIDSAISTSWEKPLREKFVRSVAFVLGSAVLEFVLLYHSSLKKRT
jgi:hypothetical protein